MNTKLAIEGMHCQTCVKRLKSAFEAVPGVQRAEVTLSPPRAEIESASAIAFESLSQAARNAGNYKINPTLPSESIAPEMSQEVRPSLYPLGLIVTFISATTLLTTYVRGSGSAHDLMSDFMAGFFLVFAFFKLLDLKGFADAYQSYDIVAMRYRPYALLYPFLELALGVAYLLRWQPTTTNAVTLVLMLIGSVGVLLAVLSKRRIRCACLGTALNLPMTTVTLVEDLGMAAMAAVMLVWRA